MSSADRYEQIDLQPFGQNPNAYLRDIKVFSVQGRGRDLKTRDSFHDESQMTSKVQSNCRL
jgi:hypothetical protein